METLTLNGRWQMRQALNEDTTWLPVEAPGCVHTDLLAAGVIPDPFYRDNELQVLWVGETDWLYRRTFSVTDDFLDHDQVLLHCAGLDTVATVRLNGKEFGRADNMFRTWEFEVKELLQPGENELEILFDSAVRVGQEKLEQRYIHNWGTDSDKLPGGNYVRKAAYHFGWDWGPKLATCGIWRDIELLAFDSRLAGVHVTQDHSQEGQVTLHAQVEIEAAESSGFTAVCSAAYSGEIVAKREAALEEGAVTLELPLKNPRLWWPKGLGEQPLYDVEVRLLDAQGATVDLWQKRIGLRTLQLDRHDDEWGESFQFRVNGRAFFAKGANWIPADSFVTRVDDDQYWRLLADAAAANMNMLRVWGGGIYEQDIFYDTCEN